MTILGIPLALPLAVLSFFGGFIPYIGSVLTTGLAFLVTLALGTSQDAAIMAIYTIVFNVVQGNFVAPVVYGRAVNIHPAIVLLAIPAGAAWRDCRDVPRRAVHRSDRDDVADGAPGLRRGPVPGTSTAMRAAWRRRDRGGRCRLLASALARPRGTSRGPPPFQHEVSVPSSRPSWRR